MPKPPASIGMDLSGTYEQRAGDDEAKIILDNGQAVTVVSYVDGPKYTRGEQVVVWKSDKNYVLNLSTGQLWLKAILDGKIINSLLSLDKDGKKR